MRIRASRVFIQSASHRFQRRITCRTQGLWPVCLPHEAGAGTREMSDTPRRKSLDCELHTHVQLDADLDAYGGVIVDPSALDADPSLFEARLKVSIKQWRRDGRGGIWLRIPINRSVNVPIAVTQGFEYHHAEKDYIMMTLWLRDCMSPLPANASTQIGVGALVVNSRNQVLLVQEGVGPLRGKDVWKIPTGIVEAGEDISVGAVRECLEETGVETRFEKIIGFRHVHQAKFGKSDLFFVCLLRPLEDAEDLKFTLQESEVAKAMWGDYHEFLQQSPYPRDTSVWAKLYGLGIATDGTIGSNAGIIGSKMSNGFVPGTKHQKSAMVYWPAKL